MTEFERYNITLDFLNEDEKRELLEESIDYNDDDEPSLDRVLEYLREERLIQIGEMYDIDYWDYQINNTD